MLETDFVVAKKQLEAILREQDEVLYGCSMAKRFAATAGFEELYRQIDSFVANERVRESDMLNKMITEATQEYSSYEGEDMEEFVEWASDVSFTDL